MTKRDYIYGGIIIAIVAAVSVWAGINLRKQKEWAIELLQYKQTISQLDDQLKIKSLTISALIKKADSLEEERASLGKDLVESNEKLKAARLRAASKVSPITLEECKVYSAQLEGHITLLEKSLQTAEAELFTLRDVLTVKDEYIDTVEDKLKIQLDVNKVLKRMSKKDKRVKIWSNVLSGGAGLVVGWGLGKVG